MEKLTIKKLEKQLDHANFMFESYKFLSESRGRFIEMIQAENLILKEELAAIKKYRAC